MLPEELIAIKNKQYRQAYEKTKDLNNTRTHLRHVNVANARYFGLKLGLGNSKNENQRMGMDSILDHIDIEAMIERMLDPNSKRDIMRNPQEVAEELYKDYVQPHWQSRFTNDNDLVADSMLKSETPPIFLPEKEEPEETRKLKKIKAILKRNRK